MKNPILLVFAALCAFLCSCSTLSSPLAQGVFNTAAETATTQILVKDSSQLPALQSLAAALPTAFKGSLTSENIGTMVKTIGKGSDSASTTIAAALDGAVRNYTKQNGGDVMTLQGAIVQQILTNFADGMSHGITVFTSSR